ERVLLDDVALDRILQVVAPVQRDGARDVTLLVEIGVLVDLGHDDVVVGQMPGQPLRADEDVLGIPVCAHGLLPKASTNEVTRRPRFYRPPGVRTMRQSM